MEARSAVSPNGLDTLVDGIPGFFETLRKQSGFGIEPAQVLSAQGLILNLAASGQLPHSLRGFKTLIGPIVCATKRQQDEFARRFDDWVATIEPADSPGRALRPPDDLGRTLREVATKGQHALRRAIPILALGVVVILATVYFLHRRLAPKPGAPPVKLPPISTPVKLPPIPTSVDPGKLGSNVLEPPVATTYRPTAQVSSILTTLPVFVFVVLGVGFELAAGFWLFRRWSRKWWDREAEMILRRREAMGTPRTTVLKIRPPDPWPPSARQQLGRAAVGLLRRGLVEAGGSTIDVAATLDRTVRRNGPCKPVTACRLVTPEYLVLVDRVSLRDHQAEWADSLVERLAADQVSLVRFEFTNDPRVCYPRRESRSAWTLRDLAERYADHRLLLFTDGERLLDPWTGLPAAWTECFSAWEIRALLTPLPPANWTAREDQLAAAGFLVEPATPDGLVSLASVIAVHNGSAPDAPPVPAVDPVPPLPEPLRYEPERWLDSTPPPADEVKQMTRELRWYLKGDYDWLAACSIYPELRWDLTLELGRVLSVLDNRPYNDSTGLSRLVRLPWFRQGSLPDWLRLWLSQDLEEQRSQAVRGALEQLLVGAERVENAGFTTGPALTIARASGGSGTLNALAQGVRRSLARRQAPDEPLNDYVFAGFLEGRPLDSLDFRLPAGARALLEARTDIKTAPSGTTGDSQTVVAWPGIRSTPVATKTGRPTLFEAWVVRPICSFYQLYLVLYLCLLASLVILSLAFIITDTRGIVWVWLLVPEASLFLQWRSSTLPARVARGRTSSPVGRAMHVAWGATMLAVPFALIVMFILEKWMPDTTRTTDAYGYKFWITYLVIWCLSVMWLLYLFGRKPLELALRLHRSLWLPLLLVGLGTAVLSRLMSVENERGMYFLIAFLFHLSYWPEATLLYETRWKSVIPPESRAAAVLEDGQLASRGKRLAAAFLDGMVIYFVTFCLTLFLEKWNYINSPLIVLIAQIVVNIAVFLLIHGYFLKTKGQTIGKKLAAIRIADLNGNVPSFATLILRRYLSGGLLMLIPFIGLLDILFIFRADRRCLHDLIAGTKVVDAK